MVMLLARKKRCITLFRLVFAIALAGLVPNAGSCGEASMVGPPEKPLLLAQGAKKAPPAAQVKDLPPAAQQKNPPPAPPAKGPPGPPPPVGRPDQLIFELAKPMADSNNFNWYYRASVRENGAHQVMWEPLFLLDYKTGNLEPWLAEKLTPNPPPNPNSPVTEWTLTLRDGVEWSDSNPPPNQRLLTAADVIFTVQMALDQRISLPALEAVTLRAWVASVSPGPDPLTVIFTLRNPNPRFKLENFAAALFSSFLIMPKHIWNDTKDPKNDIMDPKKVPDPSQFRPKPIGTGPYKLKEAKPDHVTWERNDKWWGAKPGSGMSVPKPLQVIWQVKANETASKADLIADKLDAAREYTLASFNDAKTANAKIIGWDPNSALAWNDPCGRQIDINIKYVRADQKLTPWSDPKLRQALSLLIDRMQLASAAYAGTTQPSRTMFPEYGATQPFIAAVVAAHNDISPTADPAKAATLLQGAGYQKGADGFYAKGGAALDATILVNADVATDVAGANAVAAQLNAAGIKTKVQSIPNEEYWGRTVPTGDYEMVYGWLSCGSIAEPYTSMSRYTADKSVPLGQRSPGFNNTGRWDTQAAKDYSTIVNAIGALPLGEASIPGRVGNAYKYLADEMPFVPLVQSPKIIPFNTTYWVGWPAAGGTTVPMHTWAATHRLLQQLKKAN
jgi:peptide/nickel transport system substrate-binding protein